MLIGRGDGVGYGDNVLAGLDLNGAQRRRARTNFLTDQPILLQPASHLHMYPGMVFLPEDGNAMRAVRTQDVPLQLAWLDKALGDSTAPWKLVFGFGASF